MINLLNTTDKNLMFHSFDEHAYSLYSTPKNAYRLPAKANHRIAMTDFLSGTLDIFECTLKRVIAMDGVYAAFAGAKSCLLRSLG